MLLSFLLLQFVFLSHSKAATDPSVAEWCTELSKELRSVKKDRCVSLNWRIEAKSQQGKVIPYLDWEPTKKPEDASSENKRKRILILGAIHGDEISAVSMLFRWIDFLDHTKADSFLREHTYLFVPLVNPDGFFVKPRTRVNKSGVDLNRNFATEEWKSKALLYWKQKAKSDPRRYPGASPASEIETKAVQKLIDDFKPNLIISVHAPYKLVDHDGPIDFPDIRSPLPLRTLGAYPGSLGTYAGIERNIPVVTPELPNAKQLPDLKSVGDLFVFIMKASY